MEPINLWEIGILLIGIAFLVLFIALAMTVKNIDKTVRKVEFIVDQNTPEINHIIGNIAGITTSADTITSGLTRIVGFLSGAKLLGNLASSGRKDKRYSRRD